MAAAGVGVQPEFRSASSVRRVGSHANRPVLLGLLLVIATCALYYPVHHHPFINYDDRDYVYENPAVQSGLSLHTVKWAFTTYTASNWHPVTWLSHALDCQLFGLDPAGHHDENVLFHALDVVLLFWVLLKATGDTGRNFMVAALFALHPINVESVAWVAERKNVLSTMFFLLALGAYRWYAGKPRIGRYAVVAALYAMGLMAKPQIITLPFVLLLWDYWPLERIAIRPSPFAFRNNGASALSGEQRTASSEARLSGDKRAVKSEKRDSGEGQFWPLVIEKLPLLLIAAASAVITLHAQRMARSGIPRMDRAGNAILSYGLYIRKAFWPSKLALFYPHPQPALSWTAVTVSAMVLCSITALVIFGGMRHRYLPVGWFWFLGTLVPMLGLVQVGAQAMADRYAYISFIGLFIMVCWGVADLAASQHWPGKLLPVTGVAVLVLLSLVARLQIDYWQSDFGLWEHALQVTTGNWMAESQAGTALAIQGKVNEAMPYFYRAVALDPNEANSNMGIAIYDVMQGNYSDAIKRLQLVVKTMGLRPSLRRQAYLEMAKSYQALGDAPNVQQCLRAAQEVGNH